MDTDVYFVRHGAHDVLGRTLCGRQPGVELSAEGKTQAAAAAQVLSGASVSAVFSSPLERTSATAGFIAKACGTAVITDEALNEIDFGDWTGAEFAALDEQPSWRRWNADRGRARTPGGESMLEAQLRIVGWLEDVRQQEFDAVVAVSHADMIKAALAYTLGLPLQSLHRFDIDPGSISRLTIGGWGAKVLSINERPSCPS